MKYANMNPKLLIVYFSRSGMTRRVAEAIASASAADVEEIREASRRGGLFGYLRSGFEGALGRRARILPPERDPGAYDVVIVGTPTWSASVSSPVREYLASQRASLPQVAFFVTMGGREAARVLEQMAELAGKAPLAALALSESYLVKHPAVPIGEFLETILAAWERRSQRPQPSA